MKYISVREAAKKWQVSERRVHQYCKAGRIEGLQRFGRSWAIPENAAKPINPRSKREAAAEEETHIEEWDFAAGIQPRVGAVITAAGKYDETEGTSPFINIGTTSLIRRIVLIFQVAHISPIVVITGYQAWEIEHHLADYGVIFLQNEQYESSDKLASVKIGLSFLRGKCDKIFLNSLKIPMFTPETLRKMISQDSMITIPCFKEKSGHPLLVNADLISDIMNYQGFGGMQGFIRESQCTKEFLEVEDEGVLLSTENVARLENALEIHNEHLLHPFVRIRLEKDRTFFDERAGLLLLMIQEFHSVQRACKQMAISRGKAWEMITKMEQELGVSIVERQQGGKRDRQTTLTKEGKLFLAFFREYENDVKQYARESFDKRFKEFQKNMTDI